MISLLVFFLVFFAFPLASIAFHWHSFGVIAAVVSVLVLPLFSAVVGIAFAIIVNDKVVLVQTTPDDLLVVLLSDFVVNIALMLDVVRVQSLLACGPQCSQLSKCGASRHGE